MDISQSPDLIKFGITAISFLGLYLYVRSFDWFYNWICKRAQAEYERRAKAIKDELEAKRVLRMKRKADLAARRSRR